MQLKARARFSCAWILSLWLLSTQVTANNGTGKRSGSVGTRKVSLTTCFIVNQSKQQQESHSISSADRDSCRHHLSKAHHQAHPLYRPFRLPVFAVHSSPSQSFTQPPTVSQQSQQTPTFNSVPKTQNDSQRSSGIDLSKVQFVSAKSIQLQQQLADARNSLENSQSLAYEKDEEEIYPFATMLRGSARYIANHLHQVAVIYIPGQLCYQNPKMFSRLLGDVALSWILGLKIVLVLSGERGPNNDDDNKEQEQLAMKQLQEQVGYVRIEVERILNRHLRMHVGMSSKQNNVPEVNGNVVSGHFYVAQPLPSINGDNNDDSDIYGYPTSIYANRIEQILQDQNVVLMTTMGMSHLGEPLVVPHGAHLAAQVAHSLGAQKLILVSNHDCVLAADDDGASAAKTTSPKRLLQEVPLGFVRALLKHYGVETDPETGLTTAAVRNDEHEASPMTKRGASELLQYLAWTSKVLGNKKNAKQGRVGVNRAHIINPSADGSLLEELFTSKNGINTCVYRPESAENLDVCDHAELYADYYHDSN